MHAAPALRAVMLRPRRDRRIVRRPASRQNSRLPMAQPHDPPPRPDIIIVVPCYNESRRLAVHAYCKFLAASSNVAILFVDDGSTDDMPLVLERLRQQHSRQVFTLRLSANVGKAEAVRRGVLVA